ncbi:MAG: hypothetical protein A3H35_12285 [Betaproteobacteria bacterium RIFCSPLOWO2_02_FULL_62_17]|nr:MAG: hypothetical protein A3H35_12285 [Betaproteobacteria bacterium RIFCSPLOWO2_02_FULL_62_17]
MNASGRFARCAAAARKAGVNHNWINYVKLMSCWRAFSGIRYLVINIFYGYRPEIGRIRGRT